jgi:hypothetical protein
VRKKLIYFYLQQANASYHSYYGWYDEYWYIEYDGIHACKLQQLLAATMIQK